MLRIAGIVAMIWWAAGCTASTPDDSCAPGEATCACTNDGTCSTGLTCQANVCVPEGSPPIADAGTGDGTDGTVGATGTGQTDGSQPDAQTQITGDVTTTPDDDTTAPPENKNLVPPPTVLACQYPSHWELTFGADEGHTLPVSMKWPGYPSQSSEQGTVKVTDYFDCDGTKGYDVLLFDTSQFG